MLKEPPATPPATPSALQTDSDPYTRLHITPLDAGLVKVIIPSAVLPKTRNISYHTLETFPEKSYGFVELPKMEAEKIKKKINGAILKGTKIRIEMARPENVPEPTGVEEEPPKKSKKKSKDDSESSKKRKRDPDVIEGVDLRGRKVKRGWTVPEETKIKEKKSKSKKDKDPKEKHKRREVKSKYTDKEELLFKTKLPKKAPAPAPSGEPLEESDRKTRKKEKSRETVVHEFSKTTKFPTFLKAHAASKVGALTTEFVDGKGWVDSDGNVVEAAKGRARKSSPKTTTQVPQPSQEHNVEDDTTSSSGTSEEDSDSDSEEESDEEHEPRVELALPSPLTAIKAESSRPKSSSSNVSLTIKIPPVTPASSRVHPLEALYKRPKTDIGTPNPALSEAAPFSFFDAEDKTDASAAGPGSQIPMTPYTQMDIEWRNVRSAAPTPDTAHPNRTKPFWAMGGDDEDDEDDEVEDDEQGEQEALVEEDGDAAAPDAAAADKPAGNDFQKWFWENRRDLNRSWMKRRKTASKEKRHKENKARASRAV